MMRERKIKVNLVIYDPVIIIIIIGVTVSISRIVEVPDTLKLENGHFTLMKRNGSPPSQCCFFHLK